MRFFFPEIPWGSFLKGDNQAYDLDLTFKFFVPHVIQAFSSQVD